LEKTDLQRIFRLATSGRQTPTMWMSVEANIDNALIGAKNARNAVDAERYLDVLAEIQYLLAKLVFKYKIEIPSRLLLLVREFDRSDDPDLRKVVLARIKREEFLPK
jgi:hypothetical protein